MAAQTLPGDMRAPLAPWSWRG